uniref:ATP synthase F0 subunit 8 n=1 Tax=Aleyrodes shizuokensis TaxID=860392 RepID=A0A7T1K7M0_9HEMI|nr:ATP synthase F0 subunit 8 [Aleyrodes shizuokensis]QPO06175.1 ATP synthase F0 subunit 8 [Aleyrodes shizuokensis]
MPQMSNLIWLGLMLYFVLIYVFLLIFLYFKYFMKFSNSGSLISFLDFKIKF